jgi:DUF4097 and DUF4098 domain-containing protein YvlB
MKAIYFTFMLIIVILSLFTGCGDLGVNRTIQLADGERHQGELNSVNGEIIIGRKCEVTGSCRSVNGGIEIKDSATVHDLVAINGSISVAAGVQILGEVTTVNGTIDCQKGVVVKEELSTINGDINLNNTTVKDDVQTVNGDITLQSESVIEGDVVIRTRHGFSNENSAIHIVVGDNSVVKGDIINRDESRRVKVILSGGGQVLGSVQQADIIRE